MYGVWACECDVFFCLVWGRKETCLPRAKDLRKGGGGPRHAVHVIWVGGGGAREGVGEHTSFHQKVLFFFLHKSYI